MKSILQLATANYRPKIEYAGKSGNGACYHITLRPNATEDDIYACKESVGMTTGCSVLCYHTAHNGLPHLGVFTAN